MFKIGVCTLSSPVQKRRLLIADDDIIFRTVASHLAESWGYELTSVDNGEDALKALTKEHPPTIAMLDWLMPKFTGPEICKRIRSENCRQYIYFMLVSSRDGREDALEGLNSGADTYITKPLDADELHAKLKVADRILFMEESLRDLHAETELFINAVPSILIGTDLQGRITRWNLAAEDVFKMSCRDVQGRSLAENGVPWKEPLLQTLLEQVLRTGQACRPEEVSLGDGGRRLLTINVHPVLSHLGSIVGTLIVGDDVTEKKIREDQLRQAQKLEGIGQLAAGIAHEINTPTQFVSDNITFVKDSWDSLSRLLEVVCKLNPAEPGTRSTRGGDNEILEVTEGMDLEYLRREIPRAIDETLEGLQRITKIVRAMKEFSHPGSSQKALTDINRAVQSTVTVASNEWKYVADLETDLDPGLPQVPCMVDKFNQVVLNLLINAVHAIAEATGNGSQGKGRILVKTRMVPGAVEISIADTGAGVPESIRDRIFELFFSTKEVGKGTGQGLALAHTTIVTEHNGKIWFESEVGKGTTFFVQLPLEAGRGEKSASAAGD